jgi:DNA-binding transcriptional ArsR family regulator
VKNVFYVRTTTHWKALSHPLRVAILKLVIDKPMTNERLAVTLRQESGKLYFHTKQLLEAGMIEIVETRMRGTIAEKVYGAVARAYVATGLPQEATDNAGVVEGTFTANLTPEQASAFTERLQALLAEFEGTENGSTAYSLRCLMHPLPEATSSSRSETNVSLLPGAEPALQTA